MSATEPCERCGRLVVDGSTDWGGWMLVPTCAGIEVHVSGRAWAQAMQVDSGRDVRRLVSVATADELRDFLERAYGRLA